MEREEGRSAAFLHVLRDEVHLGGLLAGGVIQVAHESKRGTTRGARCDVGQPRIACLVYAAMLALAAAPWGLGDAPTPWWLLAPALAGVLYIVTAVKLSVPNARVQSPAMKTVRVPMRPMSAVATGAVKKTTAGKADSAPRRCGTPGCDLVDLHQARAPLSCRRLRGVLLCHSSGSTCAATFLTLPPFV